MATGPVHVDFETESGRTPARSRRIYVASSWRNLHQQAMVHTLRAAGFEVYDFKHPNNDMHARGFHWSDVAPTWRPGESDGQMSAEDYLQALAHPIARQGFERDLAAMLWADTCVLVLPCGRSAHLELGWFTSQDDKRTAVFLEDQVVPELMYGLVDHLATSTASLLRWLGVED